MLEAVVVLSINLVSVLFHDFNIGGHVNGMLSQFLLFLGDGRWRVHFAQHECLHVEMRRVFYQSLFSEML